MTGHSQRAARALAHLPEVDPALAALALWCGHRDGDGAFAARTEGETIIYGAAFPALPLQEQVGLAGHHVLHVALRHGPRMAACAAREGPGFEARLYNLAADAIVNAALAAADHALPRPSVDLAEVLRAAGLPATGPDAAVSAWDADRLYAALVRAGAGARARVAEHGDRQGFAEDLAPAAEGDREDAQAADWQGRVARALEAGHRAGRGLGLHADALGVLGPARVPWERRLRGLVARAVQEAPRRSHRRPARAWIAMEAEAWRTGGPVPVFAPGLARDARRPRIVVGLDTSGSIDADTLRRLAAEIDGIARRTGAETHLLAFDDRVHMDIEARPGAVGAALSTLPLRRGGGTDFAPVIARAASVDASVAVVLTDLDGPAGPAPRFPVIWAVAHAAVLPVAPFGQVLELQDY